MRREWSPDWAGIVSPGCLAAHRELYQPPMPPLDGADALLGVLLEIGPTLAAGAGEGPVSHEEIAAWQRNTGIELAPWECRALRAASQQYISESYRAVKRNAPPPWAPPDVERRPVVSDAQAALRALANL
jgi:hypothetical protein